MGSVVGVESGVGLGVGVGSEVGISVGITVGMDVGDTVVAGSRPSVSLSLPPLATAMPAIRTMKAVTTSVDPFHRQDSAQKRCQPLRSSWNNAHSLAYRPHTNSRWASQRRQHSTFEATAARDGGGVASTPIDSWTQFRCLPLQTFSGNRNQWFQFSLAKRLCPLKVPLISLPASIEAGAFRR